MHVSVLNGLFQGGGYRNRNSYGYWNYRRVDMKLKCKCQINHKIKYS
jgi:hypothetical protein